MEQANYQPKPVQRSPVIPLIVISTLSLGFIAITDRLFFKLFMSINRILTVIPDLRLTSLAILILTYAWIKRAYPSQLQPETENRKRTIRLAVIWLVMTAYFVLVQKVWVPKITDVIDIVAFMVTGLIGEEILFRGILFDLSSQVFGRKKLLTLSIPVLLTSVLFGVQHLAYHRFEINSASVTQVVYTTAMGIVFAKIKEDSGKLWPVIVFHMLLNSFTLIRNFGL